MSTHQPPAAKRNIPAREARERLGVGPTKFWELVGNKRIPVNRIGRRVFVSSEVLDRLIDDPSSLNQDAAA